MAYNFLGLRYDTFLVFNISLDFLNVLISDFSVLRDNVFNEYIN
jgi:hypothetical protein